VLDNNEQGLMEVEQRLEQGMQAFIRAKIKQGYSRDDIIKMGREIIKRQFFKVVG